MNRHPTSARARAGWLVTPLLMLACFHSARGQPADSTAAPPFKDYEFTQYVSAPNLAPKNVLDLDNNGDIALAARGGITRTQLKASGVSFSDSQIALLETWRLLEERGDTLRTLFPILTPEQTRRLRQEVQTAAPVLAEKLAPEVRRLTAALKAGGRSQNAYTIIFSYVLDGLVWNEWQARGVLEDRKITAENPLWSGEVWALCPARPFAPGTNSVSDQGISLRVSWTDAAIHAMLPFVTDIPTFTRMFDDYVKAGRVEDSGARRVFGPYDLFDADGRFTVPVIVEDRSNPLYQSASDVAGVVARAAPGLLGLPALVAEFRFRDEKQALVVAYHELMWDLMDGLEARRLVQKPVAFAEPAKARPADIAALVFVVRSR